MCTIDAFIERHTTVLRDHLGMPCKAITCADGERAVSFRINNFWCLVAVTAPIGPELVLIQCRVDVPPELDAAATARVVARLNQLSPLTKAIQVETTVFVTCASLAGPPNCLPTTGSLIAVLPRLHAAMASTLRALLDEVEFERLSLAASADERES